MENTRCEHTWNTSPTYNGGSQTCMKCGVERVPLYAVDIKCQTCGLTDDFTTSWPYKINGDFETEEDHTEPEGGRCRKPYWRVIDVQVIDQ